MTAVHTGRTLAHLRILVKGIEGKLDKSKESFLAGSDRDKAKGILETLNDAIELIEASRIGKHMISIAEALAVVEASNEHKILKRLPEFISKIPDGMETRQGLYLDCESTGLDTAVDEVIEFGAIPFRFTLDGYYIEAMKPLHYYNEPRRKSITPEITKITGITNEMVSSKVLEIGAIERVLDITDLIIAHNAAFDRPMMERISEKFEQKYWGCSMTQVPWGTATRKLEYLLTMMGYFYEAHNAVTDCKAGLFAISQPLGMPKDSTEAEQAMSAGVIFEPGLSHILEASRAKSYHLWAIEAPYEVKDELKTHKYYWNGGEDGRPKSWHKEIAAPDTVNLERLACDEENFLKPLYARYKKPYKARFDRVTAKERFTKRG